jgi:parallel beta-helix repeat protein
VATILIAGVIAWIFVRIDSQQSEYVKRTPIYISGNTNFTTANGVVGGSGSEFDPYVIANWDIDASQSVGIYIQDANAHFVLTNCYIHGGSTGVNDQIGIILNNCSRGLLISNLCSDNLGGISLEGSSKDNILINNLCSSNSQYGIVLHFSDNNTLDGNKCSHNGRFGIIVESSNNNIVRNNAILHNSLFGVSIDPDYPNHHTSMGNRLWNNTLIDNNGAVDNFDLAHVQANDSGNGNWWNSTNGYGNYWSDWTTPDSDHDGVVDVPYVIAGNTSTKDLYPLVAP